MPRIPDPNAGKQPYKITSPNLLDDLRDEVKSLRTALRTIANDPKCPAHIAVLARTAAFPNQG